MVWSMETWQEVARWPGHTAVPLSLKWAPRRALVASAEVNLALWLPNMADLEARGVVARTQPAPAGQLV